MAFKNFLREYFTFNRRERNGVFVLLSIILLLILYLSFSDIFFSKDKTDFSKFEKEIAQFESEQNRSADSVSQAINNSFHENKISKPDNVERFNFNPNNLPQEDWQRLGLSDKQIRVIKNYESKGGKFYKKEDLKKIYGISEKLYASLESYIQIGEKNKSETNSNLKNEKPLIELNSADTSELKKIKGIGSVFAKRISKFRDMLGGFVKKEQLLEVYGFDKEKFDLVSPQITFDTSIVRKININSASVDDLKKHPYMNKKAAVAIFTHRVNAGDFKNVQEIKELNFVDEELYVKISPYLKVE